MAEVLLFHHAAGLTDGVTAFADTLREAGHTVHTPDLYDGRTFSDLEEGIAHAKSIGFGALQQAGIDAADDLPEALVYAGFSIGVMPAQWLAQNRAGARGALFFDAAISPGEFGGDWPAGVPVQIHAMDADEFFVGEEGQEETDADAARLIVEQADDGRLYEYQGSAHLFADSSLPSYDEPAAAAMTKRALDFLAARG